MLPRLMLRPQHPDVCVRPLDGAPPVRRIVAVRLAGRYLSPSVARFLDLLRASASGHANASV